jgi:O-antigen ligase
MLLVFLMPVYGKILPSVIFLMVMNWLIEGKIKKIPSVFRERNRMLTFSFASLYVFYLIGMAYSKNMGYGLFDLEVKFSLILFPLIFATVDNDFPFEKLISDVVKAFVAGCVAGTLILLGIATCFYIRSHDGTVFFYTDFSKLLHPSYLSMYLNLAVSILAYYLIRKEQRLTKRIRILLFVLLFYFSLMTFLLDSKAGIFSLIFLSLMIIIYYLVVHKKVWRGLLLFFLSAMTFFALFTLFPNTAERFKKTRSALTEQKAGIPENVESNNARLIIWTAGVRVIRKHPVFGVGTGDVKDALLSEYQEENNLLIFNMRLNAHNQYLQTFIALGIFGVLLLISLLVLPGWMAIRRIHFIYFSFLAVFAINIFVESMLEVQAGVVYYAFFNALFFSGWASLKKNGHTAVYPSLGIKPEC